MSKEIGCFDCGLPYSDDAGFQDLIIPDEVWRQISPDGENNGLLCPNCICKRLYDKGIKCEGKFTSGPLTNTDRIEQLENALQMAMVWLRKGSVLYKLVDKARQPPLPTTSRSKEEK